MNSSPSKIMRAAARRRFNLRRRFIACRWQARIDTSAPKPQAAPRFCRGLDWQPTATLPATGSLPLRSGSNQVRNTPPIAGATSVSRERVNIGMDALYPAFRVRTIYADHGYGRYLLPRSRALTASLAVQVFFSPLPPPRYMPRIHASHVVFVRLLQLIRPFSLFRTTHVGWGRKTIYLGPSKRPDNIVGSSRTFDR